jgi:hypothetical protein
MSEPTLQDKEGVSRAFPARLRRYGVYTVATFSAFCFGYRLSGLLVRNSEFVLHSPIQYSVLIFQFYTAVLSVTVATTLMAVAGDDRTF